MIRTTTFAMALLAASATGTRAATDRATIARGEYLAHMADCAACHTGGGRAGGALSGGALSGGALSGGALSGGALSGGRAFKTAFGTIYATNITPDPKAGVGGYTDDEWVAAMQRGVARGGKHLYPVMPYTNYTLMSREDALAIKAYIMTQPSSTDADPANGLRFPFNIRFLMVFWNLLYNADHRFTPDGAHDAAWNRGAYLAEALGHCQQCHTPRNVLQGLKAGQAYAGAVQQGWAAYNITSDAASGIGRWSEADLSSYLTGGHADGHGVAAGPMAEAVSYSLRYLTNDDARALAHYLKALPAKQTQAPPPVQTAQVNEDALGARIFEGACAGCHRLDGTGGHVPIWGLSGDHSVSDPAGTNLVQAVMHGGKLSVGSGDFLMPGFTRGYTDEELAAVANYTIGHFGQKTGWVGKESVAKARQAGL